MTAKEFLQQYRQIDREIYERHEEIVRLRSRAERITATLTGMPGGGPPSDWTDIVARIVELTEEMDVRTRELVRTGEQIEELIDGMVDPAERRCIRLRYVNGHSWLTIARKMHYSHSGIMSLHARALASFTALWKSADSCGHNSR